MQISLILISFLMAQTPAPKPAPANTTRGTTTNAQTPKPAASAAPKPAPQTPKPTTTAAPKPTPAPTTKPALTTDEQKAIYALGLSVYRSLSPFALSPAELELVKRGLSDAASGAPAVKLDEWELKIDELVRARKPLMVETEKAAARVYTDKVAKTPGAVRTASGLVYRETAPGTGSSPKATDTVTVHYRGTLIDGSEFDSSYKRNQSASFPLGGVIRCWTEGVQMMKVGGKAILVCPSDTAYGDGGRPGIPGGATLTFEIELLEIRQ